MADSKYARPSYIDDALRRDGFDPPSNEMAARIGDWYEWWTGQNDWYAESYVDVSGRRASRRRLSLRPARRVCREWASLIASEATVSAEAPAAAEWLDGWVRSTGFMGRFQDFVERTFALGTGALGLWLDTGRGEAKLRRYDANMVIPLSWDEDGVTECAFATRATLRGKQCDQLQEHVLSGGAYVIRTRLFADGRELPAPDGVLPELDTGCPTPTFAVFRPAIENTYVDLSPYGVSVFADAVDAIKTVDMAWTALYDEVDLGRMVMLLPDTMIEVREGQPVPFGGDGQRLYRKAQTSGLEDGKPYAFAPALRTEAIYKAYGAALAQLGDLTGFGLSYFKPDRAGGIKTATEVSADSSELMRTVRKHENLMGLGLSQALGSLLTCARTVLGAPVEEDFGAVSVGWDDSIVTDTQSEKTMAMAEMSALGVRELKVRYLVRYYGMTEEEAQAAVPGEPTLVDAGY